MSEANELLERTVKQPHQAEWGHVNAGQVLRIIDVEGGQIADFISLRKGNPREYLDIIYSCAENGTYRLTTGCTLVSNQMNPMWTIVGDSVGQHYCGGGFCSAPFRQHFDVDDRVGCRELLEGALKEANIDPVHLRSVSCFNIFMGVDYGDDGSWTFTGPTSSAGDSIELRAEMDQFWAVSLCTGDSVPDPGPLRFEVFEEA